MATIPPEQVKTSASLPSGSPLEVRSAEDQAFLEDVRRIREAFESWHSETLAQEHDRMQAHRAICHEEDCPWRLPSSSESGTPQPAP